MYKKIYLLVIVLAFLVIGQTWNMGPFDLFERRTGTYNESVWKQITYMSGAMDTVYTKPLAIGENDGIYKVEFSADSVAAKRDSIDVYVAFYDKNRANCCKWTPWHLLWSLINSDTLYELMIDPADSTWWKPEASRQYRIILRDGSADSMKVKLTDYIR